VSDLARWQFATTSIYQLLFVPVTIGLAFLTAMLQTVWHRSDNPEHRRLTRFFGVLLVIKSCAERLMARGPLRLGGGDLDWRQRCLRSRCGAAG
jgi:Cytochrome bd terminal oxidase subunit I